jgi:hypothetical protein
MGAIVERVNNPLLHGALTDGLNMVCNPAMNKPHPDKKVIADLGGPAEVARALGLDPANGGVQRVHNWMTRGIPSAIRLDHLEYFGQAPARPAEQGEGPMKRAGEAA